MGIRRACEDFEEYNEESGRIKVNEAIRRLESDVEGLRGFWDILRDFEDIVAYRGSVRIERYIGGLIEVQGD